MYAKELCRSQCIQNPVVVQGIELEGRRSNEASIFLFSAFLFSAKSRFWTVVLASFQETKKRNDCFTGQSPRDEGVGWPNPSHASEEGAGVRLEATSSVSSTKPERQSSPGWLSLLKLHPLPWLPCFCSNIEVQKKHSGFRSPVKATAIEISVLWLFAKQRQRQPCMPHWAACFRHRRKVVKLLPIYIITCKTPKIQAGLNAKIRHQLQRPPMKVNSSSGKNL